MSVRNDVHWCLTIVNFDQKTIFLVNSCENVDCERDATAMLAFFWLALLKKHAATRHSSRRDTCFMLPRQFQCAGLAAQAITGTPCLLTDGFNFLWCFHLHEDKRNTSGARHPDGWGQQATEEKSSQSGKGPFVAPAFVLCHCNEIKTMHESHKLTVQVQICRSRHACWIHEQEC
jgi:hypothetical protein